MLYSKWDFDKDEPWALTWQVLHLTREERDQVFLTANEASQCKRRNGRIWLPSSHHYPIFKQHIDVWMRKAAGHYNHQIWECDRDYYPNETLPELPVTGRFSAWEQRFKNYYGKQGGWFTQSSNKQGHHSLIGFLDDKVYTEFALTFL